MELKVKKIHNGTVIDHITPGYSLGVLRILGLGRKSGLSLTIAMNVVSGGMEKKDILKVEGRELKPDEVNKIALIAPNATINIIRDYKVIKKEKVNPPDFVESIVHCVNPECITNTAEPVERRFVVVDKDPPVLRCTYCGRTMTSEDVLKQF